MRKIFLPIALIALASIPAFAQDAAPRVDSLTTEHLVDPIGIGNRTPRLSWKIVSTRPGERQTAYQVPHASDPAKLDSPDLWDSGKIQSDQSVLVPWAGKPLGSRSRVTWQVRTWDQNDKPTDWSKPATLELGLLDPQSQWKGQWITTDLPRYDIMQAPLAKSNWISAGSTPAQAAAIRIPITLPPDVKILSASVDAAADGLVALYVNGKTTRQGSSSHTAPFHAQFPTQLAPGKNIIAIGAAPVRLAARGGAAAAGHNAIAAHISIDLDNGQHIAIDTDGTWKAAANPPTNWFSADFDDGQWPAATIQGAYSTNPPRASSDSTIGAVHYLRKNFTAKGPIAKARLYSTALGVYEASINGNAVNDHSFDPGWTDYAKRVMVQTTDVTALLSPGRNVIGAMLSDGWFAGRVGWDGLSQYRQIAIRPLFAAQLEITYADGSTDLIATDESWKGGSGEIVGSDLQLGEVIDESRGSLWDRPDFDDTTWKNVILESHNLPLVPQAGPPVRKLMELPPKTISRIGNLWVVDFGQNLVGHIALAVSSEKESTVRITHGEVLNPDGTVYTENLRPAISLDTFHLMPGGDKPHGVEPHFTFHGFRYVQLAGYPGELPPGFIRAVVVGSDTPYTGTFECSNPDVNRLYQNILWGQRGNFISVPTDCPQRDERMGWMGDAQVFAPTAARDADVASFFTKWMIDVNDAQGAQGEFNNVSPRANQNQSYPVWGDAGVIIPWVMYTNYGDKAFLESCYDHMRRWVDYEAQRYPNLLPSGGVGDHLAPIAARGAPGAARGAATAPTTRGATARGGPGGRGAFGGPNTTSVVDAAYFAHSAQLVSRTAALLNKPDDAAKYDRLFQDIRTAFNNAYVQPDGTILAGTQTTYLLALRFDLLPENLRPLAINHLVDDITTRAHITTGFVGVGQINPTLTAIGRSDLAYQLLLTDTYPSWLYAVKQGATTIWERWDGWTADKGFQDSSMNSFNHYSLGAVGEWLYSGAAGIGLDEQRPGYKHFTLAPQFTNKLAFVRASQESPYGTIRSAWKIEGNQFQYDATVPPNSTATLVLPGIAPKELLPGTYHFTIPAPTAK